MMFRMRRFTKPTHNNENPLNRCDPLRYSIHKNFITPEECNHLINIAKESVWKMQKSQDIMMVIINLTQEYVKIHIHG